MSSVQKLPPEVKERPRPRTYALQIIVTLKLDVTRLDRTVCR